MQTVRYTALFIALLTCCLQRTWGAETDQFMTWDIELRDCSAAFNRYINNGIEEFLGKVNQRTRRPTTSQGLVQDLYLYFFQGLHASRVREWLKTSEEVDRYPDDSISLYRYQRESVFRGLSFPYILPMSRTIRVGEVYTGIDKIGHFFGYGRRYFHRYLEHRQAGLTDEEAMQRIVRWGILHEGVFVGKVVDGIFSHGDLEANFQGFRMARDLCDSVNPCLVQFEGRWQLERPVDMRDYVTPDFDESYNTCHYWAARRKNVLPLLRSEYCEKRTLPNLLARFARYRRVQPSFSQRVIEKYYEKRGRNPQREQSLEAICAE